MSTDQSRGGEGVEGGRTGVENQESPSDDKGGGVWDVHPARVEVEGTGGSK